MSFLRWAPTFLGFPLGGWVAALLVGPVDGTAAAALAGALAGLAIGTAQWLALGRRLDWRWLLGSIIGMAAGSALSAAVTGAATTLPALVATGLLTGAVVGAAQGLALGRGVRIASAWTVTVSLSWAAGWAVTANVIIDADSGYVVFGASGAILVTAITGLALHRILGPASQRSVPDVASAEAEPIAEPVR